MAWTLCWAICGIPSFLALGRSDKGAQPTQLPILRLDVRALGYSPPAVHDERMISYPLPRMGPLSFCEKNKAVVTFVTRAMPGGVVHRGEADSLLLPLRLHALFVDTRTGRLRTTREWPTDSDRSRVTPAPGGGFVVVTPEQLTLYSAEMMPLKEVPLSIGREAELVSFRPEASPGSKYLLIKYEQSGSGQEVYRLVKLKDLQVTAPWGEYFGGRVGAVSDSGIVTATSAAQGSTIGKPGNPKASPCPPSYRNCLSGVFVSDSDIFGVESPHGSDPARREFSIHLVDTKGRVIFDQELPHGQVIQPFYPAVGGQRFAIAIYQGRGGSQFFDIAPRFLLDRIMVYDLPSRRWIYTLDGKSQGIKSVSATALSADGSLLGLIDQGGILQVYRLPLAGADIVL